MRGERDVLDSAGDRLGARAPGPGEQAHVRGRGGGGRRPHAAPRGPVQATPPASSRPAIRSISPEPQMPSAAVSPIVCTCTSSSTRTRSMAPCAPRIPWRICAPSSAGPAGAEQANRRSREPSRRSEEHTSELQSPCNLVCRLLLEKKKYKIIVFTTCILKLAESFPSTWKALTHLP